MTDKAHIQNLINHGAMLVNQETGELTNLTLEFYRHQLDWLHRNKAIACTYEMILPGIDETMGLRIRKDGHVDSGSMESIEMLEG